MIQTFGRAARNVAGQVILYADEETASMKRAIEETVRRRKIQMTYNKTHHITPNTIKKEINSIFNSVHEADYVTVNKVAEPVAKYNAEENLDDLIARLEKEMQAAAQALAFEKAAELRDQIEELRRRQVFEF
jgi:excinuclease ABC subunit B